MHRLVSSFCIWVISHLNLALEAGWSGSERAPELCVRRLVDVTRLRRHLVVVESNGFARMGNC